jgi:hypothetical protein
MEMRKTKLICVDCGAILDEDDLVPVRESRGEFWGMPCSEELGGCPKCRCVDFEEYDEYDDDEEGEDEE